MRGWGWRAVLVALGLIVLPLVRSVPAQPFRDPTARGVWQSGEWNIAHIGSTVHLAGGVTTQIAPVAHITSVTHAVLISSGHANVLRFHVSGSLRVTLVANCGTGASQVLASNPDRRDLMIQNAGKSTVWVGYGAQGHVVLTAANGWGIHAGSSTMNPLTLWNYQGPLSCISAGDSELIKLMEIWR